MSGAAPPGTTTMTESYVWTTFDESELPEILAGLLSDRIMCYRAGMNLKRDIKPITYLKNRATDVVQQVSEGRTMIITQNGEAKMVIMGVEEYDGSQSALALPKIVQASESDVRKGRTIPQEDVFRNIEVIIEDAKRNRKRSDS